jgi:hypothetical protein
MTRADIVRRVSVTELIDWVAFFKLENQEREREQARAQDLATARQMAGRFR